MSLHSSPRQPRQNQTVRNIRTSEPKLVLGLKLKPVLTNRTRPSITLVRFYNGVRDTQPRMCPVATCDRAPCRVTSLWAKIQLSAVKRSISARVCKTTSERVVECTNVRVRQTVALFWLPRRTGHTSPSNVTRHGLGVEVLSPSKTEVSSPKTSRHEPI